MRYEIINIFDEDYGCEGIPENEELMCVVFLRDENGNERSLRLSESFITDNSLKKGSYVLLEEA